MSESTFVMEMAVRDYECDMQGVVNNAVYQNYLEHARHVFLLAKGIDFAEMTRQGIHLVVTRAELDYVRPLRSGSLFTVSVSLERISRLRFGFRQVIAVLPEGQIALRALVTGTALDRGGRPKLPAEVEALLASRVE